MSRKSFHVKRGDTVKVISGNHRGSSGKILQLIPAKSQVIIEGVRMIKKHVRKSQDNPNGAIIEREGPLHVSNVKLVEGTAPEKQEKKKTTKKKAA
jgi:large subunit ribosomal protein L24